MDGRQAESRAKVQDEENGLELPASIQAAWGLRERPVKGPKPGLSLERIVAAAVKVADAEGLAAVSMSRVAAALGTSAMSLYRYVAAKDELLALMVDAAIGPPPPPEPGEGWREGLSRWAWAYRTALYRHPWVLRVPISGPPVTPNGMTWLEDGLRSLRETDLTEGEKLSTILLLSGFVRNEATLMADISAAARASDSATQEIMPSYGRLIARLTDAARFPALHQALASGVLDADDDPDDEFMFGLDRILDGVDELVRRREDRLRAAKAGAGESSDRRRDERVQSDAGE
jgi:AcrR family transcriptional regulator